MSQQLWQVLFSMLVFGGAVSSGIAVLGSARRARSRPRGQKHRNTPIEIVLICLGFLFIVTAFSVAVTKAYA
jgi:heme/copper-type cytochrome/quinol oxidase subunit 2